VDKNIYTLGPIYSGAAIVKNYSGLFLKLYLLLLSVISFGNISLSCYRHTVNVYYKDIQKYYDKIRIN